MGRKALFIIIGGFTLIGMFIGALFIFRKKDDPKGPAEVKSFTVFIDNVEYSKKNDTITFVYSNPYNYKDHIRVLVEYNDGSEEEVYDNEYDMATNITETSDVGNYFLTVAYGGLAPVNIKLVVEPLVLDFTKTKWNDAKYVYNGKEQVIELVNLPVAMPKEVLTYSNNTQTNAGSYEVGVSVIDSKNYSILNYDHSLDTFEWTINKLVVDLTDQPWNYSEPFTYDGTNKEIELLDLPEGLEVKYSNNIQTNAGTYTARATFIPNPDNVEFTPDYVEKEFVINKKQINFSQTRWDDLGNYVYNGIDQKIDITDVPRLPEEVTYTLANNEKKDAGTYTATFTINESPNYECVGISDELLNHNWSILKAKAKFTNLVAYNKTYDGMTIDYTTDNNVNANPYVTFKKNGESEYSPDKPTNSGGYTLKAILEDCDNYIGAEATVDFVISKKSVSWPKGNVETKPDVCISCGKFGSGSVYVPLIGFDENIMKFTDDSDSPNQSSFGIYKYKVVLKDTSGINYTWDDSTKPGEDYTWFFNLNMTGLLPFVWYNGKRVGMEMDVDEFEAIEYFHPGDTLQFDTGSTPYVVHIDGQDYSHQDSKYTIGNSGIFEIEVIDGSAKRVYYRVCKISNEFGINEIKINDTNYYYDGNAIYYDLGDNQEINLEFKIDKSTIKTLIVNNNAIDLNNPKITLKEFGDSISVTYLCYNSRRTQFSLFGFFNIKTPLLTSGSFVIEVNKNSIIESFDVIAINASDSAPIATNYGMKKMPESFEITISNSLIYDIKLNYYDKAKSNKYTYNIIDTDTNKIVDFSRIKPVYNLEIQVYDESGKIKQRIRDLVIRIDELVYNGFECVTNPETKEKQYVNRIDTNSITLEVKDSLFKYLDMYHDIEKTNIITFVEYGVYREKIVFKKSIYGINYNLTSYIDIIYSEKLSTFADVYYSYNGGNKVYNGQNDNNNNVLAYDSAGNQSMIGIYDMLNVTIGDFECTLKDSHDSYHDGESKIEFLDEHDKNLVRFVITLKFHDDVDPSDVLHTIYLITYYSGTYSDNTGIVGEKAVETYSIDSSHVRDVNIENNNMTMDNISPLYSYEFELENEADVCLKLVSSEELIYEEKGASKFSISFSQEGDYKLTITAVTGATRDIFIHVSGNFGNIIETQIGDGTKIYIDNNLDTNLSIYDDETGTMEYLVGFFGNDSISHVSDNKVEIKISGSITDYIFKDANLANKINTPTDTLDVLKDSYDNLYIELFMENKYFRLYLTDKPNSDISINVGGDNFGLIYKNGYNYYGNVDTNMGNFYVKPSGFTSNLVVTANQVYDDFSYAIIIVDSIDEFDLYTSYSEMESQMKLFRVKDNDTLSFEIKKFENRLIYILPFGTTDDIYNPKKNAHPLIIDMPVYYFHITAFDDNSSYYYGFDTSGNEITNADTFNFDDKEFYFLVGKDKGSSSEGGGYVEFNFESTYIDFDDLFYRDNDEMADVKCYDSSTGKFKVKHNKDEGDVIIFFSPDHSNIISLAFVDKTE